MKKATIHRFETTTIEDRYRDYLKVTGKTEKEMSLKQFVELEHKVYYKG